MAPRPGRRQPGASTQPRPLDECNSCPEVLRMTTRVLAVHFTGTGSALSPLEAGKHHFFQGGCEDKVRDLWEGKRPQDSSFPSVKPEMGSTPPRPGCGIPGLQSWGPAQIPQPAARPGCHLSARGRHGQPPTSCFPHQPTLPGGPPALERAQWERRGWVLSGSRHGLGAAGGGQ